MEAAIIGKTDASSVDIIQKKACIENNGERITIPNAENTS